MASGEQTIIASPLDASGPDPHAEWEAYVEMMDRRQTAERPDPLIETQRLLIETQRELAKERERAFAAEERLHRVETAARLALAEMPWARVYDGKEWSDHPAAALRQELDRPMCWSGKL